ncbi:MAG: acetyl/propionyl/methylcrotonyl-CoA carboxylase subunit alpha [Vulcanimicrobiaceae bacterium]
MFSKILVANRGEIAVRIMRTAREMGILCVAVYSEIDRDARHVALADEAYLLGPAQPSQSYLNSERILDLAERCGAQAIHPGYGFLAESAAFCRAVTARGLIWIGPHAEAIDAMGDKLRARQAMERAGVPFVPGGTEPVADLAAARRAAQAYGFPLALKASGGGGGKGLKIAHSFDDLESAYSTAQREAIAYFQNGTIYAERYLENPKHIELQVLADKHGSVLHVGERDCSLQRRHQKLWEEAPALIPERVRTGIREAGIRAARAIGYDSAGTIEYLVADDKFYFLEMNTRIQVEHTVSEMISGLDLIREQIRVAAGEPLGFSQETISFSGAAIEARINAEDPTQAFRPAPGRIKAYREPGGPGVRIDSAASPGYEVVPDYDSMIAKLIVWAPTRQQALARMRRALDEYVITGIPTTLGVLRALCESADVQDARYTTATLEPFAAQWAAQAPTGDHGTLDSLPTPHAGAAPDTLRIEVNDRLYRVRFVDEPSGAERREPATARRPRRTLQERAGSKPGTSPRNEVVAPMHGVVVDLPVSVGERVCEGGVLAVVEAMKMMNEIRAHTSGVVSAIHVSLGSTVEANAPLVTIAE